MGLYNRHRRDKNHKEIVDVFRRLGCSVLDLSQLGNSAPDVCVGMMNRCFLVEIKSDGGGLTPGQVAFRDSWLGERPITIWTAQQAQEWVTQTRLRLFRELSR